MSRPRQLHLHEIFYLKDKILTSISCQQQIGIDAEKFELAVQEVWPMLLDIIMEESRLKRQYDSLSCEQIYTLKIKKNLLLKWCCSYINTPAWQVIQNSLRQKRRLKTPDWIKKIKIATYKEIQSQPRWINPMKKNDPFAARMLVPRKTDNPPRRDRRENTEFMLTSGQPSEQKRAR